MAGPCITTGDSLEVGICLTTRGVEPFLSPLGEDQVVIIVGPALTPEAK